MTMCIEGEFLSKAGCVPALTGEQVIIAFVVVFIFAFILVLLDMKRVCP